MSSFFFRAATAILGLALVGPASATTATECPWDGSVQASATMTTVTVNGQSYDVKGELARQSFSGMLMRCGADDAALHFSRWRNARLGTNASAVGGVVVDDRAFFATAASALFAGRHKRDLVYSLNGLEL